MSALVDAEPSGRSVLLTRRAVLATTRDVLTDEAAELRRRAAAEHVAGAGALYREAEQRYLEAKSEERELCRKRDAALEEQRVFRNRGRAAMPREEGTAEAVRLAQAVAELAELAAQASHDSARLQAQREAAAAALAQAQREAGGMAA